MKSTVRGTLIFLLCVLGFSSARSQTTNRSSATSPQDPLAQIVGGFTLSNQTLSDGIGRLNQVTADVGFSIEFPLGATIGQPAPTLSKLTMQLPSTKVSDLLDRLCNADPAFTWKKNGNMINVFPRTLENNEQYVLNRPLPVISLNGVGNARDAVFQVVNSLAGHREQIAMLQTGSANNFAEPWTATFHDTTVREMLNRIAQQLGPTYGWQFGGAADFRVITFHSRISPSIELTQSNREPPVAKKH